MQERPIISGYFKHFDKDKGDAKCLFFLLTKGDRGLASGKEEQAQCQRYWVGLSANEVVYTQYSTDRCTVINLQLKIDPSYCLSKTINVQMVCGVLGTLRNVHGLGSFGFDPSLI